MVKDNKIDRRVVRIGQRQDAKVEILEGVAPGELLVVRGLQRVRPGATVVPRPIGEEASPPPAARRQPGQQGVAPAPRAASALPQPVSSANAAERP